jgi:hypothetical protein
LRGADLELARDQRQCHAGHEDDKALKELAGRGQHPDAQLHLRHRHGWNVRTIWPNGPLIDIVLNGAGPKTRFGLGGLGIGNFRHADLLFWGRTCD